MKTKFIFFNILFNIIFISIGYSRYSNNIKDNLDSIKTTEKNYLKKHKYLNRVSIDSLKKSQESHIKKYNWINKPEFENSPDLIYEMLINILFNNGEDYLYKELKDINNFRDSEINYIISYYTILLMINENIDINQATYNIRRVLSEKNIIINEESIKKGIKDSRLYLEMANISELIKKLSLGYLLPPPSNYSESSFNSFNSLGKSDCSEASYKDFSENKTSDYNFLEYNYQKEKTINYKKPLSFSDISIIYDTSKMNYKEKNILLYGLASTKENYKSGYYKNQNDEIFKISQTLKAKTPWEILDTEFSNDIDSLTKKIEEKVAKIPAKYKTELVFSKKTSQDECIEYASKNFKVAIISFANGHFVGNGTLLGKIGQEETLMHCIAGLHESLLPLSKNQSKTEVEEYKDVWHSPEVTLYTENATLIKRYQNNVFLAAAKPYPVNIIHSASINFDKKTGGYSKNKLVKEAKLIDIDPYKEITRRIRMQFATAILTGNEVLIAGLFGCGKYAGDKSQIAKIYLETFRDPLFNGKLKYVVFASGDLEPYSSFGFN